jgi:hypothetical protein
MTVIELKRDALVVRLPEVHPDAVCHLNFQRTLRIPDDNREYPLPAGLGPFPLHAVDDFAGTVPAHWLPRGGVFLPMYQAEALWICFGGDYPFAIKVAAGKVNAVSGGTCQRGLAADPQDYVVTPGQPWLDGFAVQKGLIRQFVAMPLGEGYTAEEQLTGAAEHGGLQFEFVPMRAERYEALRRRRVEERTRSQADYCVMACAGASVPEMGLAPGGLMRQHVYADPHGLDAWDQSRAATCFVHIANSASYRAITGARPPTAPVTADTYQQAGIPWFNFYGADETALAGAPVLAGLDSVAAKTVKLGGTPNEPAIIIAPGQVKPLGVPPATVVREGQF